MPSGPPIPEKSEKSGVKDLMGKSIDFFKDRLDDFKAKYDSSDLMKKIVSVAKAAGASTVYHALLLYYALINDKMPASKKIIVIAALGYFISPLDFIPDFILMGLLDDSSILLYVIHQILPYVDEGVKVRALSKLKDWFGTTDIVSLKSLKSDLLPDMSNKEPEISIETVDTQESAGLLETDIRIDDDIHETDRDPGSDKMENTNNKKSGSMEITAPYRELNTYVAERFHQPIALSYISEKEVRMTYTKRVIFKNMNINIRVRIDEVKPDSILLSYTAPLGLDLIAGRTISRIIHKSAGLKTGIRLEDGRRIIINLSEIEMVRPLMENIALRSIKASEDSLRIGFSLKVF